MSINATFVAQLVVFFLLVIFTVKFVWPPLVGVLDARALKIKEGLAAADSAKAELVSANQRVEAALAASRSNVAAQLADAEQRAQLIIEEAKLRATQEGDQIIATALAEAQAQTLRAREALRDEVAILAVKGAEQILKREVNAGVHLQLLAGLKAQL